MEPITANHSEFGEISRAGDRNQRGVLDIRKDGVTGHHHLIAELHEDLTVI